MVIRRLVQVYYGTPKTQKKRNKNWNCVSSWLRHIGSAKCRWTSARSWFQLYLNFRSVKPTGICIGEHQASWQFLLKLKKKKLKHPLSVLIPLYLFYVCIFVSLSNFTSSLTPFSHIIPHPLFLSTPIHKVILILAASRNYRSSQSPNRSSDPSSQNVIEPKGTFNTTARSRSYDPDVNIRPRKNEDPPTRDRRKEDYERPVRGSYDVRYLRDMTKRMRESNGRQYTSYVSVFFK